MTDAILLAGGRVTGALAEALGAEVKALGRVGGRTLLQRAVRAVQGSGVRRTVVIGPPEVRDHADAEWLPEGHGGIDNLFRGLERLGSDRPSRVLICATDLPFVTSEAIGALLEQPPAPLVIPILRKDEFEACFPGVRGEYVQLTDGSWTAASAFMADPGILWSMRPRMEKLFAARKSQLGMARLLGPVCTVKFLTRRLASGDVEARARSLLGVEGTAMRGCPPELAFDVDTDEEYDYAVKLHDRESR